MFTGLVQDCGTVTAINKSSESAIIEIKTNLANQLAVGDSVSVNGVCLTAINVNSDQFTADVMVQP